MRAVRRKTAEHLSYAWSTIPHVTHSDKADITEIEQSRKRHESKAEAGGTKLTVTAIAVKVVAEALKMFPQFASSIDMAREELIYKQYCHIGVAVDTDRGLLVLGGPLTLGQDDNMARAWPLIRPPAALSTLAGALPRTLSIRPR
jgi:pyruvate dehydrogenase E2 component (dihydrolipoamide acetyltransferase)